MYVTICQPPHPHVHGHNIPNLFHFGDAQQGCTTVWTPSTWCLNTKHVMGWDENANPLSGQSKCLENHLFILFQHFAGYTMVILCWRSTGRINRHFTMVYHLWRPPRSQCFENPLKTNVGLLFGGWFFFHWRSAVIPRIIYTHNAQVQRQLRPLSRATKTSLLFHCADTTVVLRARTTGMHQV